MHDAEDLAQGFNRIGDVLEDMIGDHEIKLPVAKAIQSAGVEVADEIDGHQASRIDFGKQLGCRGIVRHIEVGYTAPFGQFGGFVQRADFQSRAAQSGAFGVPVVE